MSTPQVIMLAHVSLKHIRQRLATFLRFIQRNGITSRKLCTALFRHFVLSLRFLLSRWQILCEKQWRRVGFSSLGLTKPEIDEESGLTINADRQRQVSGGWTTTESTLTFKLQPITDEQIIIPINNVACSLYPSIIGPREGSSSSSSQTLDAVMQCPEMLSPSDDRTTPSLHISVSDDSNTPIYITTQAHLVSSPTSDPRRPHHRLRGYRSDSTESTDKLGSGEISRLSRDMTLVAGSSTTVSSPNCVEDQGTLVLSPKDLYPVAPENFSRHEKRRKMLESNPLCSFFLQV